MNGKSGGNRIPDHFFQVFTPCDERVEVAELVRPLFRDDFPDLADCAPDANLAVQRVYLLVRVPDNDADYCIFSHLEILKGLAGGDCAGQKSE